MGKKDQPPVISLSAPLAPVIECGGVYNEPGATAMDDCDGDISGQIQVSGTVNTSALGDHLLTYAVTDSFGNPATPVERTVTVVDTTPPVITLIGGASVTACQGQPFADPGTAVADNCDTGLTATVTGTVDTTTPGDYTLTYNATDTTGNQAVAVVRTVTVVKDDPPTVLLVGERIVIVPCGSQFNDPGAAYLDDCAGGGLLPGQQVETSHAGAHVLTYSFTDSGGHTVELERLVIVDCAEDVSAQIPDVPLRTAIKSTLGKQAGSPVTPSELRQIAELRAVDLGISNLNGIEYLQGLTRLDLHHNQLVSIADVRFNDGLIELDLRGNGIEDLTPLSNMSVLQVLNLHDNHITDIAPLEHLTGLNALFLSRNDIEDIQPLVDNIGLVGERDSQTNDIVRWDRINIKHNPDLGDVENIVNDFNSEGVWLWADEVDTTKGLPGYDYRGQFRLMYDQGTVTLETFKVVPLSAHAQLVDSGTPNSLRVTDENDLVVSVPVDFNLERAMGDSLDPGDPQLGGLVILDQGWDTVYVPITGAVAQVEYVDADGVPSVVFVAGAPPSGMGKSGNDPIAPVEGPDDAIPISVELIHGREDLPDDRAFVIAVLGDAYQLGQLGTFEVPLGVYDGTFAPWSLAAADSMRFLLEADPNYTNAFHEYQDFIKIYRFDFISRDELPASSTRPNNETALHGYQDGSIDYTLPTYGYMKKLNSFS